MEKKIIIGEGRVDNYVDMKGPCPEGFHVPTNTELIGLRTLMEGFGFTVGTDWNKKLHMPFTGYRSYDTSNIEDKGTEGRYWSSSVSDTASICLSITNSSPTIYTSRHGNGYSIRGFKNFFETPDSSWIVIEGTLGNAGIFADHTQGLISITGDGITGYTIMDKNIGATEIYNDGDTLSEANCGWYFQWGNNYGFSFTGSITTSSTQVDARFYGPYYNSGWFRFGQPNWSTVNNHNLRGYTSGTNEAMKGPAPDGFHIPTQLEWQSVYDTIVTTFGLTGKGNDFKTYLKMPFAGNRSYTNGSRYNINNDGFYWSTEPISSNSAYALYISSSVSYANSSYSRADALSLRCFKNYPVEPNNNAYPPLEQNNWISLYDGSAIATGAGIFHCPDLGLISISGDGINWITMADRNLGATQVYNDGDTLSKENCGGFFQWGNNYMFSWASTPSGTSTRVDASNYGSYYSSSTFITGGNNWSSTNNNNLWGFSSNHTEVVSNIKDIYMGEGKDDYSAMQGPAPTGYHISTKDENVALIAAMTALGIDTTNGNCMKIYLKMPFAGYRYNSSAGVLNQGTYGYYWSAYAYTTNYAYILYFNSSTLIPQNYYSRADGFSLRCFKDVPVIPDNTRTIMYDGSSTATGAGIFHNSTDGLISISSDGENWITIRDKNEGATIVYNDGDALSESNCGKYYQWGNNYGFAWTGSIMTSSTQIDASGYGPGNYYSLSTFITGNNDWSSVQNDNLRGGVTGVQKKSNIKIYQGSILVWGKKPGIYHNKKMGLISISGDGFKWYTIQDKNLGATQIYNDGDILSQSNCGCYFQRGNNNMFPFTGYNFSISNSQVDTTGYGPGNYYNSNIFITSNNDRSSIDNKNLWGGQTGTNEAMQGPAPNGFHIPTISERQILCNILVSTFGLLEDGKTMKTYLKMPYAGFRDNPGSAITFQGDEAKYRSTSTLTTPNTFCLHFSSGSLSTIGYDFRARAFTIRCFRNKPIIPDDTWEILYQL